MNKSNNKISNKGQWSAIGKAVLAMFILGICLYFLYADVLHGAIPAERQLQKCQALSMNKGVCKSSCDPTTEFAYPGLGCTGKTGVCCVVKNENMNDVILPTPYGGDTDKLAFEIAAIDFGDGIPSQCQIDPNDVTKTKLICEPDHAYKIPINIEVRNYHDTATVFADPIVVINGNADKVSAFGKYRGSTTVKLIANDKPEGDYSIDDLTWNTVSTFINIPAADAYKNDYWEIFPYIKCETDGCRKTDDVGRGILVGSHDMMLTISFESKAST